MTNKKYHSCFVVDVQINGGDIVIKDSMKCIWHIDVSSQSQVDEFKGWLAGVFMKGVAQTLSVFEYETRGEGVDEENWIVKFVCPRMQQAVNG